MPRLVQQVGTAQADQQHFQQRVADEHTRHDTRYRQQVVPQSKRLRLACERPQQDVGQHGDHIAEIAGYIAHAVQPQRAEHAFPSVRVALRRYGLLSVALFPRLLPGKGRSFPKRVVFFLLFPFFLSCPFFPHFLFPSGFPVLLSVLRGFASGFVLQVGFLLPGGDHQRHVPVSLRAFALLGASHVRQGQVLRARLPPAREVVAYHRYPVSQPPVGFGHERVFRRLYSGGLPAESLEYVVVAAEDALADTQLRREGFRPLRPEARGHGRYCRVHTDEAGQRRPRPCAAQHHGVGRDAQHLGRAFLYLARTVGRLAAPFDLLGQRRTAQGLRQPQQARFGRLADDVFGRRPGHPFLDQPADHQLLYAVVHERIGQVAAQLPRQFVVALAAHLLHDGLAPPFGHVGEVLLHRLRAGDLRLAHFDIVLGGLRVPFARRLEHLIRVGQRLHRRGHQAEDAARRGRVFHHLLALLLGKIGPRFRHDGCDVAAEIAVHQGLYLREPFSVSDAVHSVSICLSV